MEELEATDHIGDGVYVLYDGYGVWLYANHHKHPTGKVYLEPYVLNNLVHFMKSKKEGK